MTKETQPRSKQKSTDVRITGGDVSVILPKDLLDGITGPRGPKGLPGKPGENGLNGNDGADGKDGKRGAGLLAAFALATGVTAAGLALDEYVFDNNPAPAIAAPFDENINTTSTTTSQPLARVNDETSTTTTTIEAPQPKLNLYALFAQDIVTGLPELNVDQVEAELRYLDSTLPANLPFVSQEKNSGLIFHPATGGVIEELEPIQRNAPEGGFAYFSWGNGKISFDGKSYEFPYKEFNVYQTFVIGNPDSSSAEDLNTTLKVEDYAAGHVYTNQGNPRQGETFNERKMINREKFVQDLWYGIVSGSNCGVGCEASVTLDFIDAYTGSQTRYIVEIQPQEGSDFPRIAWVEIPMGS